MNTTEQLQTFEVRRVTNVTTKTSTLVGTVEATDPDHARIEALRLDMIHVGETFRVIRVPLAGEEFEGWAIDGDHIYDGTARTVGKVNIVNRIGYGQRLTEASVTEDSFNTVIGRTVEMRADLKASDVKDPVRWRLQQDGEPVYSGVVSSEWLLGEDDHAYNIWHFCEADVGGGELEFRAEDLPPKFVDKHRPNYVVLDGSEEWVTLYG